MEILEKLEFIKTLHAIGIALPTIMTALSTFEVECKNMGSSILSAIQAAEQSVATTATVLPVVENPVV